MIKNRVIITRTAFYLVAQFIQRAANLLLLPLLVAQMSAEQFSRYGLLATLFLLLGALFTWNVHLAPSRLIFDCDTSEQQADLLRSSLFGALTLIVLCAIPLLTILQAGGIQDPVTQGDFLIQIGVVLCVISLRVSDFGTILMQVEGKAALFAMTAITRQGSLLIGFILLSWLLADAFIAFLLSFLLSAVAAMLVSLRYVWDRIRQGSLLWDWFHKSFDYAAPTAIHVIAIWFIQSSGRWIGIHYMTLEEMAPFTLVTQIVLIVSMFSRAFFSARAPDIGAAFGKRDILRGMRVINTTVLIILPLLSLAYAGLYIITHIIEINLPVDYRPTITLMFFAFLVNIFDLIYLRGIQTLSGLKKNHAQAIVTVLSGLFTVAISFPLAAQMDDTGLILAMTLGYAVQATSSNIVAHQYLTRSMKDLSN